MFYVAVCCLLLYLMIFFCNYYLDVTTSIVLRCAEVQDLGDLTSCWIRSVEAERTEREIQFSN